MQSQNATKQRTDLFARSFVETKSVTELSLRSSEGEINFVPQNEEGDALKHIRRQQRLHTNKG